MKKLISNIMNRFGYFNKKEEMAKLSEQVLKAKNMEIAVVDGQGCCMPHFLGITDERFEEMKRVCYDAMKKHKGQDTFAMKDVSAWCKHQNELVMSSLIVGELTRMHSNPLIDAIRN